MLFLIISVDKQLCCFIFLWKPFFFSGFLDEQSLEEQHLFEIENFCNKTVFLSLLFNLKCRSNLAKIQTEEIIDSSSHCKVKLHKKHFILFHCIFGKYGKLKFKHACLPWEPVFLRIKYTRYSFSYNIHFFLISGYKLGEAYYG